MLDEVGVFYRGLVLGVMIAAPVGPIGLLCMRRTLQKGLLIGFATGLGAAFADTLFGGVAAFGVAAILEFMQRYDMFLRVIGGGILLFTAWHTWHDAPRQPKDSAHLPGFRPPPKPEGAGLLSAFYALLSGFVITMTNPVTIVGTLAVVATFSHLKTKLDATTITTGIFVGSTLWWVALAGGVALVRNRFTENRVMIINRVTAVALVIIAVWAVGSGLMDFLG
ncbi:MAG: LysE family transporter [Alphaproteobacteria bacterium]|nr:LysE family transporter [Alphaproteobacteria bacterium]